MKPIKPLTVCCLCGINLVEMPTDPEIDPVCNPCLAKMREKEARKHEASWDYEQGRWVYPDEN